MFKSELESRFSIVLTWFSPGQTAALAKQCFFLYILQCLAFIFHFLSVPSSFYINKSHIVWFGYVHFWGSIFFSISRDGSTSVRATDVFHTLQFLHVVRL